MNAPLNPRGTFTAGKEGSTENLPMRILTVEELVWLKAQ